MTQERSEVLTKNRRRAVSRRKMLRNAGAVAALTAAGAVTRPRAIEGQDATPDALAPAMRSAQRQMDAFDAAAAPDLPPLEVIVFNRMAFGPRPGDLDAFRQLGGDDDARLQAYVDQQLNPAAIDDSACDNILARQGFTTLNKSLTQLWADHVAADGVSWDERVRPYRETEAATFLRAVYSKRQLNEVLADFWHNHFNVYGYDYWASPVWVHYDRDVIRGNMLGNFRSMLGMVAKSPAMLYYLDNESNTSAGPNENFAREIFELHALGAENYLGVISDRSQVPVDDEGRPVGYIDKDVYQSTECFTGWRVNDETGQFYFEEAEHSRYEKKVLGVSIDDFLGEQDGEIVMDLLANHPGTAHFIAGKLCRRLISDSPPESIVQVAADVFYAQRNAPDQLKQVVRTILLSDEFRQTWGEKVKRPLEYAVSVLRAANADFEPTDSFLWSYGKMAQSLFRWHPPDGYPDVKEAWTGTMSILQRWRHCNFLIDWKYEDGPMKDQLRLPIEAQMPASKRTPNEIVDFWSQFVLGRALPAEERQPVLDFIAQGRNPNFDLTDEMIQERLRYMVALIFMSPSFLWR